MPQILPQALVDYLASRCCTLPFPFTYLLIGPSLYLLIGIDSKIRI